MIYIKKIYSGAYWASFISESAPADYRSSSSLSAAEVIAALLQRGANMAEIEAALAIADQEWIQAHPQPAP
jgi:hypothetical protein